jgi:hypothetical protein
VRGGGSDADTLCQQNVHFVPDTWDQEVTLLRRELERAQPALRLEEHHNRLLPPLEPAADAEAFDRLTHARVDKSVDFLVRQEIIPDKPYLKPALVPQLGHFIPEDQQVFFSRMSHREPILLMSHQCHWLDLSRMRDEPNTSPIRRLAFLYVQANELSLEQAGRFHSEWTPRGWAAAKDQLTTFEQLLYLRQPGYGTSYITGKLLVDRLMSEYSYQRELAGKPFVLRDFLDSFNREGMIPVPLMEAEMISSAAREPAFGAQ